MVVPFAKQRQVAEPSPGRTRCAGFSHKKRHLSNEQQPPSSMAAKLGEGRKKGSP